MRVWDIPCSKLCNKHLLGEHRELHCIWTYINTDKGGSYRQHPEVLRWYGKQYALLTRHEEQVTEMQARGFNHCSPLTEYEDMGNCSDQREFVHTITEQREIIKNKGCECTI